MSYAPLERRILGPFTAIYHNHCSHPISFPGALWPSMALAPLNNIYHHQPVRGFESMVAPPTKMLPVFFVLSEGEGRQETPLSFHT